MARTRTAHELWNFVMADQRGTIIGGFFTADEAALMQKALERDEMIKADLRRQRDESEETILRMMAERVSA